MPTLGARDQYSVWVGIIYIFNLIVGTGALTLPAAFARAGWGLSTISLLFLAFMSYMNITYVMETMACVNAVFKWKSLQPTKTDNTHENASEGGPSGPPQQPNKNLEEPLVLGDVISSSCYNLDKRVELGEMANLFFNKVGRTMFYCTICVYLYGDLAIYSTAVAKTLRDVICSKVPSNMTNLKHLDVMPCFNTSFTRFECYRVAMLIFYAVMGPFVFSNVQKTKYLQILTSGMRWIAFAIMISMAISFLIQYGPQGRPPVFEFTGIPNLFGACVYSFMCHHSLPALITPIKEKDRLGLYLAIDNGIISIFYLLLAYTGAFAFEQLNDLYTLNFVPKHEGFFLKIVQYFLSLFPVFTLSTSFPIIAITLRNNLQSLFLDITRIDSYNFILRKLLFPIVTIIPPLLLSFFVQDLSILIKITGSYAGTGIQYLIPTFLVLSARRHCKNLLGLGVVNKFRSPFSNVAWAVFVLLWSFICIVLVTLNMIAGKR